MKIVKKSQDRQVPGAELNSGLPNTTDSQGLSDNEHGVR